MSEYIFAHWLDRELTASKYALITLHERRDKLLYIDGPQLEQVYMELIGAYEETVIKAEIECELLRKKQQMLQSAINRNETINLASIETELELLRQQMLLESAGSVTPQTYAQLSDEESEELQDLYHRIIRSFHPEINPNLTDTHRHLFQKAHEAYRRRDLPSLRLIYQMLVNADGISLNDLLSMLSPEESSSAPSPLSGKTFDFTLAGLLYPYIKPSAEEAAIQENINSFRSRADLVLTEISNIRSQFPHSEAEMLSDPAQIEAYKKDLELRLHNALQEQERRTADIQSLLEKETRHE